jgi:hypothetical protein
MNPTHLYKYGHIDDHSEQLFSTPTIWFSKPSSLNDPFECRPWLTFDGTEAEVLESMERVIRKHRPGYSKAQVSAEAATWYEEGRHLKRDFLAHMRESARWTLAEKIGLYCMSAYRDSILMWAHYAKEHHGFCLQFEASSTTPVFGSALPVSYSEDYPILDFYKTPHDEQVDLIFLTKYVGWEYEAEWRIIDHQNGHGLHAYPGQLLTGVIFGLRMPAEERQRIRAWVSRRGTAVNFFEAIQDDRKFQIQVQPIA